MSKTLAIVKANFEARQAKVAELREIDEAAVGRPYDADEEARVAELRADLEAIESRITEGLKDEMRSGEITDAAAALLGRIGSHDEPVVDRRSIGERFAAADEVRSYAGRGKAGVYDEAIEMRDVTDVTLGSTSGGAFVVPDRLSRVGQDFLDRRVFLLDLLPVIPVGTGSVEYVQDESPLADLADKAAETAEGVTKPQAGPTFDVVTEATPTIAAWVNITRQALADVPQMRGYLDGRLRYSLKRRADKQSISGTGAGNIVGLSQRSGIVTHSTSDAMHKAIRRAVRLGEDNEAIYEIIVMNPADAEAFDLTNEATGGIHAVPNVAGPSARTAWGLTQVRSTAIAEGTMLLIDPMAVAVLDRQQVSAYLTDSHSTNFTSNILTLLLEMRIGLALFDPKGVCKVTISES